MSGSRSHRRCPGRRGSSRGLASCRRADPARRRPGGAFERQQPGAEVGGVGAVHRALVREGAGQRSGVVGPLPLCRLLAAWRPFRSSSSSTSRSSRRSWRSRTKMVFLWENQGVCLWATAPDGEDAAVWYRNNEEGEPWLEESAPLSLFLIQAVLFEAIMHSRFGAHTISLPSAQVQPLLARLDPLGSEIWKWGGARFYGRHGALMMTMEQEGAANVFLAARTPADLTPFEHLAVGGLGPRGVLKLKSRGGSFGSRSRWRWSTTGATSGRRRPAGPTRGRRRCPAARSARVPGRAG